MILMPLHYRVIQGLEQYEQKQTMYSSHIFNTSITIRGASATIIFSILNIGYIPLLYYIFLIKPSQHDRCHKRILIFLMTNIISLRISLRISVLSLFKISLNIYSITSPTKLLSVEQRRLDSFSNAHNPHFGKIYTIM